jgi:hypothetical protein
MPVIHYIEIAAAWMIVSCVAIGNLLVFFN